MRKRRKKRVTRALERLRALIAAEAQFIGAEGVQRAIETYSAYVVPAGLVPAIMESVRNEGWWQDRRGRSFLRRK